MTSDGVKLECKSEEMPVMKYIRERAKHEKIDDIPEEKFNEFFNDFVEADMNDEVKIPGKKKRDFYTIPQNLKDFADREPTQKELEEIMKAVRYK